MTETKETECLGDYAQRGLTSCDYGLLAKVKIMEGTSVWRDGEPSEGTGTVTSGQLRSMPLRQQKYFMRYAWQESDSEYSGCISGDPSGDLTNYLNHSCDPSLWFTGNNLTARRTINVGEELTIDYSTCMTSHLDMRCCCRSAECRERIGSTDWVCLIGVYGEHMKPYIAKKVRDLRSRALSRLVVHPAAGVEARPAPATAGTGS